MLKAYLGSSRVKRKEGLLIVQPYPPMLFRQGSLPGPELMMQLWRKRLKVGQLEKKWEEYEEETFEDQMEVFVEEDAVEELYQRAEQQTRARIDAIREIGRPVPGAAALD